MKPSVLKNYAPAIAIAVILLAYLVAQFVILPARKVPSSETKPTTETASEEAKDENTTSQNQTAPPTISQTSNKPPDSNTLAVPPDVALWTTFHGGTGLAGFTAAEFPDAPVQRWQYLADGAILQPSVASSDALYFVTATATVIALDHAGKLRWTKAIAGETKESVEAPPVLHEGTLLVGTHSGWLFALDAATGDERWKYSVDGQILGSPNVDAASGTAFALERAEGVLHAIDIATGKLRWKTDPLARCDGPVSVADGIVAFGSCLPALHAYAAADGKRLGEIALCSDCQIAGGIALLGTEAYVGNRSGNLLRADLRVGAIVWKNEEFTKEIFTTPAIGMGLAIYTAEDGSIVAAERGTGAIRWQHAAGGQTASPMILGDKVALSVRGALHFLRLDTGEPVWQFEISDQITAPTLAGDLLVVASEDGTITAFGAPEGTP